MDFALNLQGLRTDETADAGSLSSAEHCLLHARCRGGGAAGYRHGDSGRTAGGLDAVRAPWPVA
jgi:hypothetical protein